MAELGKVQKRESKLIRELEIFLYEARLKHLGLFKFKNKRVKGR